MSKTIQMTRYFADDTLYVVFVDFFAKPFICDNNSYYDDVSMTSKISFNIGNLFLSTPVTDMV